MLIIALILLVLWLIFHLPILLTLAIIVGVIGLILLAVGMSGHPVGGRRHWF